MMETLKQDFIFAGSRAPAYMEISNNIGISEQLFEEVFKAHFKNLYGYALTIVKDDIHAEEIVQQVFFKLWEKREKLNIQQSVQAYLYRAVHNECLNYLKHQKVKQAYQAYAKHTMQEGTDNNIRTMIGKELETKISEALERLPEQCRTIFQMSRFEQLKYREIADKLNLSIKTIENQMGKALKIMRMHLVEYLPSIMVLMWTFTAALLFLR